MNSEDEEVELESNYHAQTKKSSQPKAGLWPFKSGVGRNNGLPNGYQKLLILILPAI